LNTTMSPQLLAGWIDAHAAALKLYAAQYCEDPEAIVQDAFCKLVNRRPSPGDVASWLYRVVRNSALDAGKRERRRRRRESHRAVPELQLLRSSSDGDDAERAAAALRALPAEQREAITLRIWSGMTLEQIAAACGCSASTAHRRYESGIRTLQERLGAPSPAT
jgi:RNA polymerase sigma-70 factor (ECF subfamily)